MGYACSFERPLSVCVAAPRRADVPLRGLRVQVPAVLFLPGAAGREGRTSCAAARSGGGARDPAYRREWRASDGTAGRPLLMMQGRWHGRKKQNCTPTSVVTRWPNHRSGRWSRWLAVCPSRWDT
jgi:hypothetical protein